MRARYRLPDDVERTCVTIDNLATERRIRVRLYVLGARTVHVLQLRGVVDAEVREAWIATSTTGKRRRRIVTQPQNSEQRFRGGSYSELTRH